MGFLHPSFLLGLASLAFPLLLHLLKRRKVRRMDFPTLRFFRLVQKRTSVLFRVGHLLLLLLRLSILAGITFLFAQPFFSDPELRHMNSGPRSVVVLWDDSGSVAAALPGAGGTFLREAAPGEPRRTVAATLRERVLALVGTRDARDRVEVIALAPRARVVFSGNPRDLRPEHLPDPGAAAADWAGGVAAAGESFKSQGSGDRTLVIASDFQAGDFSAPFELPRAVLHLVAPDAAPRENLGIVGVAEDGATAIEGRPFEVAVDVLRSAPGAGGEDASVKLIRLDGPSPRVLATARVPGSVGRAERLAFEVRLEGKGPARLEVRLDAAPDGLPADDAVELLVDVQGPRRVLAINGDPNPAPLYDELFYLRKAAGAAGLEVDEITALGDLEFKDPAAYAAVHVANLPRPAGVEDFLRRHLAEAGTVVLWAGDKLDPAAWNRGPLAEWGLVSLRGRARHDEAKLWRYAGTGATGPLAGLRAAKFWRGIQATGYWFLDPGPRFGASGLLAAQADGTPAVHVAQVDRGHVVLINAGADTEEGDLPMHPIYPSLVRRTALLEEGPLPTYRAGEQVALTVEDEEEAGRLEVLTPDERRVPVRPVLRAENLVGILSDTQVPGIYTVVRGTGPRARREHLQIRRVAEESRLAPLEPEARAQLFPGASVPKAGGPGGPRWGLRIRDIVVLLLALFLLGEAFLVGHLEQGPR